MEPLPPGEPMGRCSEDGEADKRRDENALLRKVNKGARWVCFMTKECDLST